MRSHHFVKNYFLLPQKNSITDLNVTQNTLDIDFIFSSPELKAHKVSL